jgi:hypothetical protein
VFDLRVDALIELTGENGPHYEGAALSRSGLIGAKLRETYLKFENFPDHATGVD